jgi:gamma-glutamylcyclotransferase (GGCT)/AIG2-like uncharacterized protein YtfP
VRLFTYGTLMPGQLRFTYVQHLVKETTPGIVSGRLYNVNDSFPALELGFKVGAPQMAVAGVVLTVDDDDEDEMFAICDQIEGAPDLYKRSLAVVSTDQHVTIATTYTANDPQLINEDKMIMSGNWLLKDEVSV